MRNGSKQPPDDTTLKRAIRHPKRLELLGYLAGNKTGMERVELAEVLGSTLPLVNYHLRVLQGADLVTHVEDSESGTTHRYVVAIAGR
jgi:DNA-binding transcriptional ArsR family regulator